MTTDAPAIDPAQVLQELNAAAVGLDAAADELRRLIPLYEGYEDREGLFHPGFKLRWEDLVADQADAVVTRYEDAGRRPPAKETVERRAVKHAKDADLELWGQYHATGARIIALQKWMSAKKETVSARQSVLRAEGLLSGVRR
jgi:hypothetical protein